MRFIEVMLTDPGAMQAMINAAVSGGISGGHVFLLFLIFKCIFYLVSLIHLQLKGFCYVKYYLVMVHLIYDDLLFDIFGGSL